MEINKETPLVSVITITYNHEKYIRQCIEGVLMQQTNFKFEYIIHEDASTDKTADVIREYEKKYPDIIRPIYQTENQYHKRQGLMKNFCLPLVRGRYIALCEGDDFWTDPYKLQTQADFLEANDDYLATYGKALSYNEQLKKVTGTTGAKYTSVKELFFSSCITTLTIMLRSDTFRKYYIDIDPIPKKWKVSDTPLFIWIAINGKVHYIDKYMATYRILKESASHFTSKEEHLKVIENLYYMKLYFDKRYNLGLSKKLYQNFISKRRYYTILHTFCWIEKLKRYKIIILTKKMLKKIYIFFYC